MNSPVRLFLIKNPNIVKKDQAALFPIFSNTFEKTKGGLERICIKCLKKKPDRCHHCSVCNTCTLMMDHHCPWINNWIGFFNYKYFFLLINYWMISTWFINLTYWRTFIEALNSDDHSNYYLLTVCVTFMISIIFGIIMTFFWAFHYRLILTNYTTLEYWEKKREKESTWQVSPFNQMSFTRNLKSRLGHDNWLKIMLPFPPNLQSNGTSFIIGEYADTDLMLDVSEE